MAGILSFLPGILKGVSSFSKSLGQHENFGNALSKGIDSFINPNQPPPPPQPQYGGPPPPPMPSYIMPTRNATDYLTSEEDMRRMEMAPKQKVDILSNNAGIPQIKTIEVPKMEEIKEEVVVKEEPDLDDIEKDIESVEDQIYAKVRGDEMKKEDVENKFDVIEENIDNALATTDEPEERIFSRELIEKKKILNELGAGNYIPDRRMRKRRR